MFERYTEKARRVIFFARYEASEFGSRSIETEHILLGILREEKVLVLRLLNLPEAFEVLRKEIENHTPAGEKISTSVDLPLSNEGTRVLTYATEEAERMAHKNVAGGHLLLGLLREEKCFAASLLSQRGVTLDSARIIVKALEGDSGSVESSHRPHRDKPSFDIAELGTNLTAQAIEGTLPNLIGRESELAQVVQVLCRLTRGNPVLIGQSGVGKKSIVYGLAHRIVQCQVPAKLHDSRLISLDLGVIASGVKSRTQFENNLDEILRELLNHPAVLLFVEGLHTLAQTQRFLNLANVLKPALMLGSLHCISTASPAEYRKAVEIAPWLEELFTRIEVRPASKNEAVQVLHGVKVRFQDFHGVTYSDDAIEYAVFHSSSYFPDHHLPEKAIDLIDEAAVFANLRKPAPPPEVLELRKKVKFIKERQEAAIQNHEFEKARFYSDELRKEQENLKATEAQFNVDKSVTTVGRNEIEMVVAAKTGVSIESLRRSRKPA